ncbi:MAG: hypothetical protein AMXMBFR36_17880 [Acidobacteriota bacterium]
MSDRLLIVAPAAFPLGGLATWLDGLMPGLARRGWDVTLALPEGRTYSLDAYLERHPWASVVRFRNASGSPIGRRRAVGGLLRSVETDVVLSVNFPEIYASALDASAKGYRVPAIVASLHGFVPGILDDLARFRAAITAVIGTNRLACSAVEVLSGFERDRIFHAPYGVEIGPLPSDSGSEACRDLDLVWAGRLEEAQKRVSDLPRLAASLDRRGLDWTLEIAGSGPEEDSIRNALSGDPRVRFTGDLPAEELRSRSLRPERVLLITSEWETGPIIAWEAMERGMVVVSSRFLGCDAEGILEDEVNAILFRVGDVEGAAERLAALSRDSRRIAAMSSAARSTAEERCSLARSIDAWDRALRAARALAPPSFEYSAPEAEPSGRLERIFGAAGSRVVRRLLRRPVRAVDSGDEWPHRYGGGMPWVELVAELRAIERDLAERRRS